MRILVSGLPRSGTTWVAEAICAAAGARYVHEPDNPDLATRALPVMARHGRYPLLYSREVCPEYEAVWDSAFRGRDGRLISAPRYRTHRFHRSARHVAVKSVYCGLSLEWVGHHYHPRVVLVRRNPLNIIASWLRLGMWVPPDLFAGENAVRAAITEPLALPSPPTGSDLARLAWWIAIGLHVQEIVASRHPDWTVITHDEVCLDPGAAFATILRRLGLDASPQLDDYLAASNHAGGPWETKRLTREQPNNWRRVLDGRQLAEAVGILDQFPAASWHDLVPVEVAS